MAALRESIATVTVRTVTVKAGVAVATSIAAAAMLVGVCLPDRAAALDTRPPSTPVKLVFIHHSTGEQWLADDHGGLGRALRDERYFVSDTNYGWGSDGRPSDLPLSRGEPIGSTTDIGDWWTWFRGPDAALYQAALATWSERSCSYSRRADPGGRNEIVMFKSCFPNSDLRGSASAPPPAIGSNPLRGQACGGDDFTVANAKGIYLDLLHHFAAHQEQLFVVIVAPPMQHLTAPGSARAFADWLVDDWLDASPHRNVFVFDYFTVLTSNGGRASVNDLGRSGGHHHRMWNGRVQHRSAGGRSTLAYPSAGGDDHPNGAGDRKATAELLPLLNAAYHEWKGDARPPDTVGPRTYAPRRAAVRRGRSVRLRFRVTDDVSATAVVGLRIVDRRGRVRTTLWPGRRATGSVQSVSWRCTLPRGSYRFQVLARDASGNAQTKRGANTLVVR